MKKYLIFIILLFSVTFVFAQDLIYTVSGELSENKTSLDSILVENLTNNTQLLFGNLPAQEYYQINLTKKTLGGTVGVNSVEEIDAFFVSQNIAGQLIISYRKNIATNANLVIYNINGQKVFASENITLNAQNSVRINLCNSGVFIVKISSQYGNQTFKAVGSPSVKQHDVEVSDEINAFVPFKSSMINDDSDFSFAEGDSIRISVYKNEYYARPIGKNIVDSESVNFVFKTNTETYLGISNAYVQLNWNTTDITSYDENTGEVQMTYTGDKPDVQPGDIFVVDVDTMGYLRKVVATIQKDNALMFETEQAYLGDIFVDKDIKLNTSFINPEVQMNSSNTLEEISIALTDENGYIHPVEIIYHDTMGNLITQSVIGESDTNDRVNIIDYSHNLSVDVYGKAGDTIHFHIDEGNTSLVSDAVFEFKFDDSGEITEDTKVKIGDLKTYKFSVDGSTELIAKLALEGSASFEKENNKKLIDLKIVRAKFIVGIVPVWITFDSDIFTNFDIKADTALNAGWGFESNNNVIVGGTYNKRNGSFLSINNYESNDTIFPLIINGEVNSSVRFELYPRVEIKFYDLFGSFAEIFSFVKSNHNSSVQSIITDDDSIDFVAWDSEINLGLDLKVGSDLEFLGFVKEFDPTVINCFDSLRWQSPTKLTFQTTLPAEADAGTNLSLDFKVVDSFNNPVKLCPVHITGGGTFDDAIIYTDTFGVATSNWILIDTAGNCEFTASIYNAEYSIINEIKDSVNVVIVDTAPEVATYYAADKTENSATLRGIVNSDGGVAITQRGFYWSKTNSTPNENNNTVLVAGTTGEFNATISGLESNTIYFFRAFATNSIGTTSGTVQSFKTEEEQVVGSTLTYKGKTYKTVTINGKEWMAENLAYDVGSGCWAYNNSASNEAKYGRLYTWEAAKVACPTTDGWHLPTDAEWEQLAQFISTDNGGYSKVEDNWNSVGKHLKAKSGWYNFGNGTDDYGFAGLPAGFRSSEGVFNYVSFGTAWWSSTESNATDAVGRGMAFNGDIFYRSSEGKIEAISIRCVR